MREITQTLQNQGEDNFHLPHPPTPGTGLLQIIPHPWAQRSVLIQGVVWELATSKIEPCIIKGDLF